MTTLEIDQVLSLSFHFTEKYNKESQKLPYHINLIDELRVNENAHSRILCKILNYKKDNAYPFLKSFIEFCAGLKINIETPLVDTQNNLIDVLIVDKEKMLAVIIENKIYGAKDGSNQINKYVDKIVEKFDFKKNQIYVLYLTKDGKQLLKNESLSEEKKKLLGGYENINYKGDVLDWLKKHVLPECLTNQDDIFLISALQQYVDHLNGMFHQRNREENMKQELKQHLVNALKLDGETKDILREISKTKNELINVTNYLEEIRIDIERAEIPELFNDWTKKLINCGYEKTHIKTNLQKGDKLHPEQRPRIGVIFSFLRESFCCFIEYDRETLKPYLGISRHWSSNKDKSLEITEFVSSTFPKGKKSSHKDYYMKESPTLNNIYGEFLAMANKCKKRLNDND